MKKIKIEIETEKIKSGLFKYDFPKIKDFDYYTFCFRVKKSVKCGDNILLEKNDLISFYSQTVAWGKEAKGVVFDFRKDGFDLGGINSKKIYVDFEYNVLTKKHKLDIEKNKKEQLQKNEECIKGLTSQKRVVSNIVNLINSASKRHNFSMKNDNIEELLKHIDYHLIICSTEMGEKYGITTIIDPYLPAQIILCIKKDMTSEVIFVTD